MTIGTRVMIREEQPAPLVAHLIYSLAIGGLENGLVNLLNSMPVERYRHVIICLTECTDFSRRLQRDDVEIFALHKRSGKDPVVHWRLWKLLRRLRPAILHTRNLATQEYVLTAWLAGVKRRIHGEHGWDASDVHGRSAKYKFLRRVCRPFVDRFVAVSANLRQWLLDDLGCPPGTVVQIYNGVDTERFAAGRETLPAEVPEGSVVIGTVARIDAIKDPATLLEAFAILSQNRDVFLAVIGDGPLLPELQAAARRAGLTSRAWFPGARDDIPRLLRGMQVFVLPSLNEGVSNTILEAMASGLAVVATDVGGNRELVADGETGALVPTRDPGALADRIARYVDDRGLRRRHGEAARRSVVDRFSMRSMVEGYLRVYDGVLAS